MSCVLIIFQLFSLHQAYGFSLYNPNSRFPLNQEPTESPVSQTLTGSTTSVIDAGTTGLTDADSKTPENPSKIVDLRRFCTQAFCENLIWVALSTWCLQGILVFRLVCTYSSNFRLILSFTALVGDLLLVFLGLFTSRNLLFSYTIAMFIPMMSEIILPNLTRRRPHFDWALFNVLVFAIVSSFQLLCLLYNMLSLRIMDFSVVRMFLVLMQSYVEFYVYRKNQPINESREVLHYSSEKHSMTDEEQKYLLASTELEFLDAKTEELQTESDELIFAVLFPNTLRERFSAESFKKLMVPSKNALHSRESILKLQKRVIFNAVVAGHIENINLLKQWMGLKAFEEVILNDDKQRTEMYLYEFKIDNRRGIIWTDLQLCALLEMLKKNAGNDDEILSRQDEGWIIDTNTIRQLLQCDRDALVEFGTEILQGVLETTERNSGSTNLLFWVTIQGKRCVLKCTANLKSHLNERISAYILSKDPVSFTRCLGYGKFKFDGSIEMFALVYERADFDFWQYLESEPYNLEIAYDILVQSCSALKIMHNDFRMAHGDIKPRNIFLWNMRDKIVARLGDFGSTRDKATEYRANTTSTGIGRSMGYMAPEVEQDHSDIDIPKADIYSFGKVIWVVLYRREPSENRVEEGELPDPFPDQWTRKLYEVMMLCTKSDPTQRPSSSQVCSELSNFRAFAKARYSS
jgi:serine/threonine protein kinase